MHIAHNALHELLCLSALEALRDNVYWQTMTLLRYY